MVAPVRPLVSFLDEDLEKTEDIVDPVHFPIRSAFIPSSTGFLIHEMKSYLTWIGSEKPFTWMNEEWDVVEDLYTYWPFLENSVGEPIVQREFAHWPSTITILVKISDGQLFPVGIAVIDSAPSAEMCRQIAEMHPEEGLSEYNLAFVPLEMLDCPEDVVRSAVHYWWSTINSFSWSSYPHFMDTLVFWSNMTRDLINEQIQDGQISSADPTSKRMFLLHHLINTGEESYINPLSTSAFLESVRTLVRNLPHDVSVEDILEYFSSGRTTGPLGGYQEILRDLDVILEKYPQDVQNVLSLGVSTSLDPVGAGSIGAGIDYGGEPTKSGEIHLAYERLRQPRP